MEVILRSHLQVLAPNAKRYQSGGNKIKGKLRNLQTMQGTTANIIRQAMRNRESGYKCVSERGLERKRTGAEVRNEGKAGNRSTLH
jgi:hypothetical protein